MNSNHEPRWMGPEDGPWPHVHVGGDLERAEAEWLATNNLGAYAMSTVALMHTRRQHGLLVSHLAEDFRRHVVLSHLEMTLEVGGRTYKLSTHQFPNMAPTLGYRALESFTLDPLPRWVYRFPSGTIERTLCLVPDRQGVVIAMTWSGKETARLSLRPLMPMRPAYELTSEHGGMLQKVTLRAGEVEVQPLAHLPSVLFRHRGVFMGFPDWWRKFEYLDDRGRFSDFQEDMWSPGLFEINLFPRETSYLLVSVGAPPVASPAEIVMDAAQRRLRADPAFSGGGAAAEPTPAAAYSRSLAIAAESFVFGNGAAIIAGYPWLDVWSRDTLLSITGIFLARKQVDRARSSIRHLLRNLKQGFLVSRTTVSQTELRPCLESSLWLFLIGERVARMSATEPEFILAWYTGIAGIYDRIVDSDGTIAWLSSEGLLVNSAAFPLTWMDAEIDGVIATPRRGLAVELQALWIVACDVMSRFAESQGDPVRADDARERGARASLAFGWTFWCTETNHPFDCLSEERSSALAWADSAIRPNALMALAIAPQLFDAVQAREIVGRAEDLLLTDYGLRTLEPGHPAYTGRAGETFEERQACSHQGPAWTHLLMFYVRAKLVVDPASQAELVSRILRAARYGGALSFNGQSVDADPPHRPLGIPAYAMSTATLLEALVFDLKAVVL
jgi:predicted glycogen debranching enzyme